MNIKYIKSAFIILFCSIVAIQLYAQKKQWKIISYNVYWGMRQDSTENKSKFAEWIRQQDPDIMAFQELNGFTQENVIFPTKDANPNNLKALAKSYGHPYVYMIREPSANGEITFPVALTSKYPIVNVTRVLENASHGFMVAEIEGLHLIVTHLHPFSAEEKGYEMEQMLATIKSKPADWKWLLMGDLNSVSPLDKDGYANNKLRDFIREDRKKRPFNKNLGKDDELDYSIQQQILDFGFIDTFKFFHPKFEASAPTKLFYDQSKDPIRYDYMYVSPNMKKDLVKCEIIKDAFTDVYSDHYPVAVYINKQKKYEL